MRKTVCALLLTLLLMTLTVTQIGCSRSPIDDTDRPTSKTISYAHFNTVSTISCYGEVTEQQLNDYVTALDQTLGYYHKLFDIYYAYAGVNNLNTINKNAGVAAVEVDRALIDFLLYCKELYALTDGKTNVMLGSVLRLWHNAREQAAETDGYLDVADLPDEQALSRAAEHTSIDLLVIDEQAGTVYISDAEASLDVGAIAKGYVVDVLYDMLVGMGADAVALNIGGNIRTVGTKPSGSAWTAGITNPDKSAAESIKCRIEIGATSVVTSGDYERFFTADGQRYHHIIDPETLQPAQYFSSVTIVTENSALADALSTALFCMPYEQGLALLDGFEGVEVLWIFRDGRMERTDGIVVK